MLFPCFTSYSELNTLKNVTDLNLVVIVVMHIPFYSYIAHENMRIFLYLLYF